MAQSVIAKLRARGDVTSPGHPGTLLGPYAALDAAARAALPVEYDGWGTDDRTFDLYFYGADAAAMLARIGPVLAVAGLPAGSQVTLSFGPGADSSSSTENAYEGGA